MNEWLPASAETSSASWTLQEGVSFYSASLSYDDIYRLSGLVLGLTGGPVPATDELNLTTTTTAATTTT